MIYLILFGLLLALIYAPQFWVRYVLRKYSRPLDNMPGTGGELAVHLLNRFEYPDVTVEKTAPGQDHYSPDDNAVRLSPDVFEGKSLTAIATAAHEVGHALQFNREELVTRLRTRYMTKAARLQRIAAGLLMAMPIVLAIFKVPHAMLLTGAVGVISMLLSVLMYVAILPEEWDASFNKALPILVEGEYITEEQIPAVRRILKACALTYVAAALADIVRLWRWLAIFRGIR